MNRDKLVASECDRRSLLARKYFGVPCTEVSPSGEIWISAGDNSGGWASMALATGSMFGFS